MPFFDEGPISGHCVLSVFQYEFISKEILNTNILYSVVIFPWLHVISHNNYFFKRIRYPEQ